MRHRDATFTVDPSSPRIDPDTQRILDLQAPLLDYLGLISDIVDDHPGFADIGIDTDTVSVIVHWSGDIPDAMQPTIDQAASEGITIVFHTADYSEAELSDAINTLGAAIAERGLNDTINRVGIASGHVGLVVGGPLASTDTDVQQQIRQIAAEVIGDIPVIFAPNEVITGPPCEGLIDWPR